MTEHAWLLDLPTTDGEGVWITDAAASRADVAELEADGVKVQEVVSVALLRELREWADMDDDALSGESRAEKDAVLARVDAVLGREYSQ